MGFVEEIIAGLGRMSTTRFNSVSDMSNKIKVSQAVLSKLMNHKSHPRIDVVGKALDALGAKVVFPDQTMDRVKKALFVSSKPTAGEGAPKAEDFKAVPVFGTGNVMEGDAASWLLVASADAALRFRDSLIGVAVPAGDVSMAPTLAPGDVAVVDLADKTPAQTARPVYLVRTPSGEHLFRRVRVEDRKGKPWLVLYGDNTDCTPDMFPLDEYEGDITRAIVGRVVRGWCDIAER